MLNAYFILGLLFSFYILPSHIHSIIMSNDNNKNFQTIVYAAGGIIFLWLAFLTYKVFVPSGVSKDQIAATRAALDNAGGNPAAGNSSPIKPTDASTQPYNPTPQVDPANATKIAFNESQFDFGTLKDGDKARHVFKFKNTGDKPLTISNATGSCGCTVPQFPREPIMPGAEGEINVEFDSKGKVGKQSKTVTVTANTDPVQTVLTINAEVIGDPNAPKDAAKDAAKEKLANQKGK